MRRAMMSLAVAVPLAAGGVSAAYAQDVQHMLQGLFTGNRDQDQALRQAYERGYRQGRQDEARSDRRGHDRSRDEGRRGDYNDRRTPYDNGD